MNEREFQSQPFGRAPASKRRALVLLHGAPAGLLEEFGAGARTRYRFRYIPEWVVNRNRPVSASLPVRLEPYESPRLFPFFVGMLAEGELRRIQARQARIDEGDDFALLLATAGEDALGAVTIRTLENEES